MEKNKISVIIPCYNIEEYIENTVKSVLSQTYKNIEIIAIDDGSIDKTLQKLQKLSAEDKRLKVYTKKNEGVSKTRNKGLELSTGDYIYFLDGDDTIEVNFFQDAVKKLKNEDVEFVVANYQIINEKNQTLKKYDNKDELRICNLNLLEELFLGKKYINISSIILKKDSIGKIKFLEKLKIGEDIDFIRKVLIENINKKTYIIPKYYFKYLKRQNSAMNGKINLLTLKESFDTKEKFHELIPEELLESYNYSLIISFFYRLKDISKKEISFNEKNEIKKIFKNNEFILKNIQKIKNPQKIKLLILIIIYRLNFNLILKVLKKIS
ncbi:MAG: glycosyltransferase family 2 protein [Cetobacterium sp.]